MISWRCVVVSSSSFNLSVAVTISPVVALQLLKDLAILRQEKSKSPISGCSYSKDFAILRQDTFKSPRSGRIILR